MYWKVAFTYKIFTDSERVALNTDKLDLLLLGDKNASYHMIYHMTGMQRAGGKVIYHLVGSGQLGETTVKNSAADHKLHERKKHKVYTCN